MKSIYDLKLHEYGEIRNDQDQPYLYITRVPGGWIYEIYDNAVFVPYDNEFNIDQVSPETKDKE